MTEVDKHSVRTPYDALKSFFKVIETYSAYVAAVSILALMFLTTVDVGGRFLFSKPIQGAYEVSEMLLIGVVFMGVAYVQLLKGHIRIEMLANRLNQKGQSILNVIGLVVALITITIFCWRSGILAYESVAVGESTLGLTEVPLWPAKMVLLFGVTILLLQIVFDLIDEVAKLKGGRREAK